jgi:tetratricopeptide (TPR) repeat protein
MARVVVRLLGLLLLAALATGCTRGAKDREACRDDALPPETIVAACTQAIEAASSAAGSEVPWMLYARGTARQKLGQVDAALADFDEAIRLQPASPTILVNRGATLGSAGRLDEALRDLDAALAADPRNVLALQNRGVVLNRLGRRAEARADIDRGLAIDDTRPRLWGQRCWIGAVLADELPRTLQDCDRTVALDPDDANTYNSRGFAHFRAGHFDLAIADYDRAIAGNPDEPSSYLVRGLARRATGDPAAGDADVAHALELDPGVSAEYAKYGIATE